MHGVRASVLFPPPAVLLFYSIIFNSDRPLQDAFSLSADDLKGLTFVITSSALTCSCVSSCLFSSHQCVYKGWKVAVCFSVFGTPTFHPLPVPCRAYPLFWKYRRYWSFPSFISISARSLHYLLLILLSPLLPTSLSNDLSADSETTKSYSIFMFLCDTNYIQMRISNWKGRSVAQQLKNEMFFS